MRRSTTLLFCCAILAGGGGSAFAADHREAPLIQEDPSADIADLYAFVSPTDASKLVLAMTVNPFSVPAEGVTFRFSPDVRYRFNIDRDGDAKADAKITVTFGKKSENPQTLLARFPDGRTVEGFVTEPTEEPDPNSVVINEGEEGLRVFAGPRDDPFFFDVVGFFRFLAGTGSFTGSDGFAGFNVSAIVVEVPMELIGSDCDQLQIWAETSRRKVTLRRSSRGKLEKSVGPWRRIERMGNPAVATALVPADLKDLYNIGKPKDDAEDFAGAIVESLMDLGTNDENIAILASVAVPDTLKVNVEQPTSFPNGRGLADDVIDTLLFFIFNQTSVPDGVDSNDRDFLGEFPFLAPPHQPE